MWSKSRPRRRAQIADAAIALAIFELRLESLRRPAIAEALVWLQSSMAAFTADHHAQLRLDLPPAAVAQFLFLYGGALFTLVTAPPGSVTEAQTHELAAATIRGAIGRGSG